MRQRYPRWLRRVSQLGPTLVSVLTDWEGDERATFAESDALARDAASRFSLPSQYLTSRLHDGELISLEISANRLRMTVSHLDVVRLFKALYPAYGRNDGPAMPIVYDFKRCTFVRTYRVDELDNLVPISWRRILKSPAEFLYAGVVPNMSSTLIWACVLWTRRLEHLVIVVESAEPTIAERYRDVWIARGGSDHLHVLDAYDKVKENLTLREPDPLEFLERFGLSS